MFTVVRYYAGIGSRDTPEDVLDVFEWFSKSIVGLGYVLRSGAAKGADSSFEKGCDSVGGLKEIYLPWRGFEKSESELYGVSAAALKFAKENMDYFDKLGYGARKLIARNGYQVMGRNLRTPVDFIVCYTKEGRDLGGTAQAIRIARKLDIPVFNAGSFASAAEFKEFLSELLDKITPAVKEV